VLVPSFNPQVSFSTAGGVEIEENWDKVKTITIPTAVGITGVYHQTAILKCAYPSSPSVWGLG
jgi:hypothetical protein